jgi:flagellar biosynthetic protein FliR
MSQLTLHQLIRQFGGGTQVTAFFLVLVRVTPLFILAPLFNAKMIPRRVKGVIAVALAIGLTPVALRGQQIPGQPLPLAALMLEQFVTGLAFAFAVGAVLAAVQVAGTFTDATSGFSFGAMVDPVNGNQGGAITNLYGLVGVAIFLAIGGDAWTLRGLGRTFDLVPLAHGSRLGLLTAGVVQEFASIFLSAVEVAAPALLALLVTDVAFGMVSRVVPQLNVFAVGFPVKIGVALLVVSASLPFLGGWISDQVSSSVGAALQTLHVS